MNSFLPKSRYWIFLIFLSLAACSTESPTTTSTEDSSAQQQATDEVASSAPVPNTNNPSQCAELYLTNGRFFAMAELPTLDGNNAQPDFDSMRIVDNRIIEVGNDLAAPDCGQVIDLAGNTVIPGLVDSHMHFVRATLRPGYDARELELSRSIPEAMEMVSTKAETMAYSGVPTDQWITFIGGWDPIQWEENSIGTSWRNEPYSVFPTLQQLDEAAQGYPFYIHLRATEVALTNSAGIAILNELASSAAEPIDLAIDNETGRIGNSGDAFDLLKTISNPRDQAVRVMQGFNSVGLTTVVDVGGSIRNGGAHYFSVFDHYQTIGELYDDNALTIRVRSRMQGDKITPLSDYELLVQERQARFGSSNDSMFKVVGLGEDLGNVLENGYPRTVEMALSNDWTVGRHAGKAVDIEVFYNSANKVGTTTRLILEHSKPGQAEIDLIREYAYEDTVAANLGIHSFLGRGSAGAACNGNPYKTFIEEGLHVGIGSDSTNAQPSNPWVHVYHMVTGKDVKGFASNAGGVLPGDGGVCPDERVSRAQAIQLYTKGSSWLASAENDIGTLEVGKLADIVVLNNDFFSDAVADEDIPNTKSILTLVDGKVVYLDDTLSIAIVNE